MKKLTISLFVSVIVFSGCIQTYYISTDSLVKQLKVNQGIDTNINFHKLYAPNKYDEDPFNSFPHNPMKSINCFDAKGNDITIKIKISYLDAPNVCIFLKKPHSSLISNKTTLMYQYIYFPNLFYGNDSLHFKIQQGTRGYTSIQHISVRDINTIKITLEKWTKRSFIVSHS